MSVNASQAAFPDCTMRPDFTLMTGQMFGNKPVNISCQDAIKGRNTGRLIYIERGHSLAEGIQRLQLLNYSYDKLFSIDHWQRSRITYKVLGKYFSMGSNEQKISTGVFAVILAYFYGAHPIVMSGFSFSTGGHVYDRTQHKRYHVSVDKAALLRARALKLPFYAADRNFSLESGLPEWTGHEVQ